MNVETTMSAGIRAIEFPITSLIPSIFLQTVKWLRSLKNLTGLNNNSTKNGLCICARNSAGVFVRGECRKIRSFYCVTN